MTKRSDPGPVRVRRAAAIAVLTIALAASAGCGVINGMIGGGAAAAPVAAGGVPAGYSALSARAGSRPPAPAEVIVRHVTLRDGDLMTVAVFTGGVRFVLHCGTADPGPLCPPGLAAGPAVGPHDRQLLVGAFNGGFKLSAGAGGYVQEGKVISPLVAGRASLVIYRSGAASIGVWGQGLPRPGQPVYSVRQNLNLLVQDGRPTPASAGRWADWGGSITRVDHTARSAIGENARGQLIYVASMSATPPDLAAALVSAGARIGMEMDINPEWVQLAYAREPGGSLIKGVVGQVRPASQYLAGWTRDFIAVLATWVPNPAPGIRAVP